MDIENPLGVLRALLAAGAPVCDCCDADAELTDHGDRIYVLQIKHDHDCPVLVHHEGRTP